MMKCNPILGEFIKARLKPENEFDKFAAAVEKCDVVVEHLSKGKTGRFAKSISFFLRRSKSCKVEVTGERWRWGKTLNTL